MPSACVVSWFDDVSSSTPIRVLAEVGVRGGAGTARLSLRWPLVFMLERPRAGDLAEYLADNDLMSCTCCCGHISYGISWKELALDSSPNRTPSAQYRELGSIYNFYFPVILADIRAYVSISKRRYMHASLNLCLIHIRRL